MRRRVAAIALAISLGLATRLELAAGQNRVFRAGTEAILVNVSVRDGTRPVLDLRKEDFELRDNGVVQSIADFAAEPLPIDLTILPRLNVSREQFERVWVAIQKTVVALRPVDHCRFLSGGLYAVTDDVPPLGVCSAGVAAAAQGARAASFPATVNPGLGGVLYESLAMALATPFTPDRRHVALLITGGLEDYESFIDSKSLLDAARYTDLVVEVVFTEDPGLEPRFQQDERSSSIRPTVSALASLTGGQFLVRDAQKDDLGQAAADELAVFQSSYVLVFTPRDRSQLGWHTLSVKVVKPNAGGYVLSARRGYVERVSHHTK